MGTMVSRAVWLLALALACSRPAWALDLLDVYRQARAQDPVYQAARHAFDAAAERLPQARAGLLPSLNLNAGTGSQEGDAAFGGAPDMQRDVRSWNWSLQLSQPLYRRASWVAYGQAGAQLRQAEEQLKLAEQDLVLRVAQVYFDALVAQQSLGVADAQVQAVDQQLGLAQRNFEVGMAAVTDVHEARSRLALARAQRVAALNELESRRAELDKLLGSSTREGVLKLDSLGAHGASLPLGDVQAWISQALERNAQVSILREAEAVAEREVARQRAAHHPSLDLTANYGSAYASGSISSPADIASRTRTGQVGLQFSVPLYAGGGIDSRVREAVALRARARDELESARRQALAQVRQAHAAVANGEAQIEALGVAVRASEEALQGNLIGYRTGTRINIDVLNAQQQLYAARRDLFKARADTLVQTLRLKAAAGSLDEEGLQMINALLAHERRAP